MQTQEGIDGLRSDTIRINKELAKLKTVNLHKLESSLKFLSKVNNVLKGKASLADTLNLVVKDWTD